MGNAGDSLVTPFFLTLAMALKFHIYIPLSEEPDKLLCNLHCFLFSPMHQCCRQRAFIPASQADQPGRILFQVLERSCTFALGGLAHFEPGNQLTEVLISSARGT